MFKGYQLGLGARGSPNLDTTHPHPPDPTAPHKLPDADLCRNK